jgi:hypothetical protein
MSKVLVCYDFYFGISNKKKDLMFDTKLGLFFIGIIAIPTPVKLKHVNLITSTCLNLVEQVYVLVQLISILLVSFDITYWTDIYITCLDSYTL